MNQSPFTNVRQMLAEYGLAPKKAFGQNFMVDTNFAEAVVREAAPDERALVIEIGPGTGCLTRTLLAAHSQARVLAMEIDRGLVALLRQTFADALAQQRLTLLEGDALAGKHSISPLLIGAALQISARENRPRCLLCSNLPYNAATPVLANFAISQQGLELASAIATVQSEVAERMLAKPGAASYGALSILMALRTKGKILRRVGNAVFWPRPAVDSAVIRLDFKPWELADATALQREEASPFQAFLQKLFSQRRKTLRAVLKTALPTALHLPSDVRAETLPPETILALFRAL
ncbi:MAG: 16S rRNA (adenine(1518)-N(6)/adenine(1519)-N(6))-dimethyltransferase RsmA [Planctomycetota bacterium]